MDLVRIVLLLNCKRKSCVKKDKLMNSLKRRRQHKDRYEQLPSKSLGNGWCLVQQINRAALTRNIAPIFATDK
jgi:hypothetical protein